VQPNRAAPTSASTQCFKCGEVGHRMTDCRKGDRYDTGCLLIRKNMWTIIWLILNKGLHMMRRKGEKQFV